MIDHIPADGKVWAVNDLPHLHEPGFRNDQRVYQAEILETRDVVEPTVWNMRQIREETR